jgi:phage gp36-like protein
MAYFTRTEIESELPAADLVAMLDDDRDGGEDTGLYTALADRAEGRVNAILARRYDVPFAVGSVPLVVTEAAICSLCAALYRRRGVKDEENPFAEREKTAMSHLRECAAGRADLAVGVDAVGSVGAIVGEGRADADELAWGLGNQEGI